MTTTREQTSVGQQRNHGVAPTPVALACATHARTAHARITLARAALAHLVLAVVASAAWTAPLRAQPADSPDTIDVIGTTPLGAELDASRVAGNVQSATAAQIREQGALDLADFMKRNLGSVFVNDAQSNPLQPDIQYRGFVGSPLLGLPQGLAVYQDGVRVNAIGPGTIATEMAKQAVLGSDEAKRRILSRTPMGRLGEPEEIASVAAFLVSDDASYLTGQTIYPDGGRLGLNYTVPVA